MAPKTAKPPEIPNIREDEAVQAARGTLNRIKADQAETMQQIHAATEARNAVTDRRGKRVKALLEGVDANGASAPTSEHLSRLYQRRNDLRQAEQIARRRVAEAEEDASRRCVEPLREFRTAQMAKLAAALAELGAVADEIHAFQEEMSDAGIQWAGALPAVAVGWMRQAEPDSRVNLLIGEIVKDYGPETAPDRPLLDAALDRRAEAAEAEAARQLAEARVGHRRMAGPKGSNVLGRLATVLDRPKTKTSPWQRQTAAGPEGARVVWKNTKTGEISETAPAGAEG